MGCSFVAGQAHALTARPHAATLTSALTLTGAALSSTTALALTSATLTFSCSWSLTSGTCSVSSRHNAYLLVLPQFLRGTMR